jgi:hypothetical protein
MLDPELTEKLNALSERLDSLELQQDERDEYKAALQAANEHLQEETPTSSLRRQVARSYNPDDDSSVTIEVKAKVSPGKVRP